MSEPHRPDAVREAAQAFEQGRRGHESIELVGGEDGERVVDLRIERLGTHQKCPREVRKSPSSSCPRGARSAAAAHGLAVAGTVAGADHGDVAAGAAVDELAGLAPAGLDAVVSGAALDVTPS